MSNTAIRVLNVSKAYRIFKRPQDRLKQMFARAGKRYYQEFAALRNVSFEVRAGEALGIIGRNGQGKSTLLQILAGTTHPTTGTVEIAGRVAALLELGAGFNPEFTGRENVFFNGVLQGMARTEVETRLPEVLDFAEIGEYIDQPVKTYSTGMFVRLAFASHIFQNPEILIVDEALSVGDVFFQQKCFEKIREMRRNGMTLVFVSHDMAAVRNLCDRALLLQGGEIAFAGAPDEAVSRFYDVPAMLSMPAPVDSNAPAVTTGPLQVTAAIRNALLERNILGTSNEGHGAGGMSIVAVTYENEFGERSLSTTMQGTARIGILVVASRDVELPSVGMHLFDRMNNLVFAAGTRQRGVNLPALRAGDEIAIVIDLTLNVQPGEYTFNVGCSEPSAEGPNHGVNLHRREGLGPIIVHTDMAHTLPFYGLAELPISIRRLA